MSRRETLATHRVPVALLAVAGLTVLVVGLAQTVWLVSLWLVFAAVLYGYHARETTTRPLQTAV